jgi:hypothetical protein
MHFRLGLISAILASIFFCGAKAGVPEIAALQIKQPINELQRVTLYGNTRPEANARNDRGMVPDSMPIGGLQLVLRKSAAQQHALDKLIHDLHDRTSAGGSAA